MVIKLFISVIIFILTSVNAYADDFNTSKADSVILKVENLLGEQKYTDNKDFLNVVFEPRSAYYIGDKVNSVKIMQTLKDNALLRFSSDKPQRFSVTFKTNANPILSIKIIDDLLNSMGYYRYSTNNADVNQLKFSWKIDFKSENIIDPIVLQDNLKNSGCHILDISRDDADGWVYIIDMHNARLNVKTLVNGQKVDLQRSLYAYWFDVSKINSVSIYSSNRNHWYPYISYYDKSLHLIDILKKTKVYKSVLISIPENIKYIKISDLYTLKNLKDGLVLSPKGTR